MNCTLCDKPVILQPTAAQRAERFGGVPRDYTVLFPRHAECELKKREQDTLELIRRLNAADLNSDHLQKDAPDANHPPHR